MTPSKNARHTAALASLHAAFAPDVRTTRPAAVVSDGPRSRRLVLSLARA